MPTIEPLIDAYGRYADASALADYLELLALQGDSMTESDVADLLEDNTWTVRTEELFEVPQAPRMPADEREVEDDSGAEEMEDEASAQGRRVFDILAERAEFLGDLYPFALGDERLQVRERTDEQLPYLALLAITIAHAYSVDVDDDPRRVFEDSLIAALEARSLLAGNLGGERRNAASFDHALARVGERIELRATPEATVRRRHAQDESVDAIAHLGWGDLRPGHWIFIGQATCAKSEEWDAKLSEPARGQFRALLGSHVAPHAFLAIPHHVEARHLYWLTSRREAIVLDRIRLCRYRHEISPEERRILEAVTQTGVLRP
jgi:hypothetical protein